MTATVEQIKKDTAKYFNAMMDAHAAGGSVADYIDVAGQDALNNITMNNLVPSVTEIDDNGRAVGYDLFSRLMKDRIVMLDGEVNGAMSSIACASLLFLAHIGEDGKALAKGEKAPPIQVFIDSPGGSVIAGNAIYDTMRSINAEIITVGMGMQASMGSILLAGGDRRMMTRNSKLMIHSIGSGTEGKLADQEISLEETRRLFDEMKAVYVRHIGLTPEFWDLICSRDTWLTADQALKMGFIDEIIVGDRKPAPYEKAAADFLKAAQDEREAEVPKTIAEIEKLLINTSTLNGKGERLRAELIVALSQRPEFWTEGLKAAKAAKAAAAAPANDDKKATVSKKTVKAPTA